MLLLSGCLCLLGAVIANAADTCNHNNCYRAVANAKGGATDCSSYLSGVAPAVTATSTVTIVTTTTVVKKAKRAADVDTAALLQARATSRTAPTYASACTSPDAYSSACSCLGYFPTGNIPPTTVSTKTVTTKTTSTVVSLCPTPKSPCSKTCADLSSDVHNCGTCGNDCYNDPNAAQFSSPQCCNGKCVDTAFNSQNCGYCGRQCGCKYGGCYCGYNTPLNCGGYCADPNTDRNNCGSCGNVCRADQKCYDGTCCGVEGVYPPASAYCDGKCLNTTSNDNHCGSCDYACRTGYSCSFDNCCEIGQRSCEFGGDCFPNDEPCTPGG